MNYVIESARREEDLKWHVHPYFVDDRVHFRLSIESKANQILLFRKGFRLDCLAHTYKIKRILEAGSTSVIKMQRAIDKISNKMTRYLPRAG